MKLRTYYFENAVVLIVLITPMVVTGNYALTEFIAIAAVFFTFQHAGIADRMQERQAAREVPDVECYRKSTYYFLAKEALWISFFFLIKSWAALMGAVVFFCYPFWRKWYRKRYPFDRVK